MATTIITKNGSGAPVAGDLVQGELAVDLTNKTLYSKDSSGNVFKVGDTGGGSSGTFTDLVATDSFTSPGIDDNATSTQITVTDTDVDFSGNIDVTGTATLAGADVTALDVTGTATLADADVTALDVTGTSTLADVTATSLDVTGTLTASGLLYPTTDGTQGQAVLTDGSGTLAFGDVVGGIDYTTETSNYTLEANQGVIANTTGGTFVVTLPLAPAEGDQVVVADGGDWAVTNLTVGRNGQTIEGVASDLIMDVGGISVTMVYDGVTWQLYPATGISAGTAYTLDETTSAGSVTTNDITVGGLTSTGSLLASQPDADTDAFAAGAGAGQTNQGPYTVAVGHQAGKTDQEEACVAVGVLAGTTSQGVNAIAIGGSAGADTQGTKSVAIGQQAGQYSQDEKSVAIGAFAGQNSQAGWSVAVGNKAGYQSQGIDAISVGDEAGYNTQSKWAIAVGQQAGQGFQGEASIAIGRQAGQTNQAAGGIIISSSGVPEDSATVGHIIIKSSTSNLRSLQTGGFAMNGDPIIGTRSLISTLSALRQATMDDTQDIRVALRSAIEELVAGLEQEIASMPVEGEE